MSSAAGGSSGGSSSGGGSQGAFGNAVPGFAKLRGEDFEYYMQTYSITLGRNSKESTVDLDLASIGGGKNISRLHARIFYDFPRRRFAMDVMGKNGCIVQGVRHLPGSTSVMLESRDLLQIGDKKFYFLLPSRSVYDTARAAHKRPQSHRQPRPHPLHAVQPAIPQPQPQPQPVAPPLEQPPPAVGRRGRAMQPELDDGIPEDEEVNQQLEKMSQMRLSAARESDNLQLMQVEEKEVVSSVTYLLSNLCEPGEWMPVAELHAELFELYGNVWHHSRIKMYLTSEDWPQTDTPWTNLLALLRKYPEHFDLNTRSNGKVPTECVSLVSPHS